MAISYRSALPLAALLLAGTSLASVQAAELVIESWRNDDLTIWQEKIIPAFEAKHPDIKLKFQPTAPKEYNSALNAKLDGGTAGDLITCRPFDASLQLFEKGKLESLSGMPELKNYPDVRAGRVEHRRRQEHVLHSRGVGDPRLHVQQGHLQGARARGAEDRGRVLRGPRQDQGERQLHPDGAGHRRPVGGGDHGLQQYRPHLLEGRGRPQGDHGRHAEAHRRRPTSRRSRRLRAGSPISATASRRSPIRTARTCSRSAAPRSIPTGSWEISPFGKDASFEMGAFPPPVKNAGDTCYITDHVDLGIGINAASPNKDAAKAFIQWVGTKEFAELYSQRAAGLLLAVEGADHVGESAGQGVRGLARQVRVDDPAALPDPERAARPISRTIPGWFRPT